MEIQLNLAHVSIAISGITLIALLKLSVQIGRFLERFDELKKTVKLHGKILGIPDLGTQSSNGD